MRAAISKANATEEFAIPERCFILDTSNTDDDPGLSVARARVPPGVTTANHAVEGTIERYLIVSGAGEVDVDGLDGAGSPGGTGGWQPVVPGDVVVIPPGVRQRVRNTGPDDLVFFCLCSPRFRQENYRHLESD
jgi:mannose-6-phosphate isomerase-like protein (cupin superfamily)